MTGSIKAEQPEGRRRDSPWRRQEDLLINDVVIAQAIVGMLVTGSGFLALTWSTVVLLGGFVSALPIKEFWFLTAIGTVLASTVLRIQDFGIETMVAVNNAAFDLRKYTEKSEDDIRAVITRMYFGVKLLIKNILVIIVAILIEAVLLINSFGPMASMVISVMRLRQHDYDGSDATNKGKLRAALFIFYSLALVHSVCFYCWFMLQFSLANRAKLLATQSGLDKYHKWGQRLPLQYIHDTKTKCGNDLRLPGDWNLITYAVGLLESVYRGDVLDGLRMLDVFVVEKTLPIRMELLSSKNSIQNLITMLEFTSPDLKDQEMRERAARIVANVAGELRVGVAQIPEGALQCICSLMEPSRPRQRHQEEEEKEQQRYHQHQLEGEDEEASVQGQVMDEIIDRQVAMMREERQRMIEDESFKPKGTRELIHQGLQILERLSRDDNNCREICNSQGLLPKIISPIASSSFLDAEYDSEWIDILSILLRLVRRLTGAPGEAGGRLCHEIWTSKDAVRNLLGILDGQIKCSLQLQENAMEILTEIAIRIPSVMTESLVKKLCHIFLANSGMSGLRIKAGEALVKLLSAQGASGVAPMMEVFCKSKIAVDELTNILVKDKECQISAAAILELFCCRSVRGYQLLDQYDVVNLLSKIVGLILDSKTEGNKENQPEPRENNSSETHNDEESQPPKQAGQNKSLVEINDELCEERKYLAAMLSLLVVICEKMVDAGVVAQVTSVDEALVKKLKKIIEANSENTADCLGIVKLACQAVIATIHLKPSCLKDFNENNFDNVLSMALGSMSDIDNCMLFAVKDDEITKTTRTLSSLIKEAQVLLQKQEETGNSST
ncbi:uncharacterized protein LOC107304171 [Oryza brachyantha]|uniref:uncharacterized protein LOC107304171 n=1 Tax=Oryza brachyantha TaxID=4533 RepID=UPI00077653B3|nr:uncharacterized protein LOC107304171 [Oryza brachyantha]